jgi:hypothetical protein
MTSERPRFVLTLQPLPGVDAIKALRALLKQARRRHGLRCTQIGEETMTRREFNVLDGLRVIMADDCTGLLADGACLSRETNLR